MEAEAISSSAAAAAIPEATADPISTGIPPTHRQLDSSSSSSLSIRILPELVASIAVLETNPTNVSPIVLDTNLSSLRNRETAKGADDSELGDPLLFISKNNTE